ncbi:deoxyguanosinetriphosphate triphosphohydrolase [Granulibacter bethesdensis]|uniref:Deoxyguanosinetriphosphate triphosphohydrolase-like protein n=1 Tax=Granulibacter bethesdensis (strain ATCC BAA-1260 / CGDNIH1) TaxID=391165 RepID=Q0BSP3_GRABC|nr:deoxyguanosinetriphosphate triphosphohydrolase [Granulibacter bethesdensis]ABI62159.1 Deoxyguanosinetriphosphate triphosphohydrolase [Granulibacter bethesdensis CGDNIH1]APH51986.1 Deoxyguanosinetriphosphate triphosphohydrolase [Granulibacter bethesdensis]APH64676.1 Deoxyguanosinetriphosphate triphosphohydrolase [Granulibacter bethesdensis]
MNETGPDHLLSAIQPRAADWLYPPESRAFQRSGLAPWAVRLETARGRLYPEPESQMRSPWQRDRDRIIHSAAFRKLQYKTQVFVNHEGDFFRTRLTHSLEVAQIARSMARALDVDEDLAETLALAHDLGHPPFGHAGEDALQVGMKPFGGFDHNAQSLRVVTRLENRYAPFDGLNLTWETLEGLAKHNGPLHRPPPYVAEYNALYDLELDSYASVEAQIAAMSDDIAYHSHDLDDGIRAQLFGFDDIAHLPVVGEALEAARKTSLDVPPPRLRHETIRRVIDTLVRDMITETRGRIAQLNPASASDIRRANEAVVAFSPRMAEANRVIKEFLFARMYRHWRVNRMTVKARRVTADLFRILHDDPTLLPGEWRVRGGGSTGSERAARTVCDYIAGMTDRFAAEEHRRLTDLSVPG